MNSNSKQLSNRRLKRLRLQGYTCQTKSQLNDLAFGNRFAFQVCVCLLCIAVALASVKLLSLMMGIAILGVVLPYHPFDYIYNWWLADKMGKPKLPKRSRQLKFACSIAAPWIGQVIYLFVSENMLGGYLLGASLVVTAMSAALIDLCIPSLLYKLLFSGRTLVARIRS